MLRWMKKGNDVLLLQGKQKPGDREGGGGEGGRLEEEALRSFWSQSARPLS